MFSDFGKILIILGLVIVGLGLLMTILPSSRLGRLPGDISITFKNGKFYFPITTSILLSVLLTLLLWVIAFLRR